MARAFELIANLPAEIDEITDSPPQKRKGL
jgi:hypothetical protein